MATKHHIQAPNGKTATTEQHGKQTYLYYAGDEDGLASSGLLSKGDNVTYLPPGQWVIIISANNLSVNAADWYLHNNDGVPHEQELTGWLKNDVSFEWYVEKGQHVVIYATM